MLNWLIWGVLTGLTALAALALSLRTDLAGRAERALACFLWFWALIVLPIFVLGYLGQLYPLTVALLSLAQVSAILAWCARAKGFGILGGELRQALAELLQLGPDALRLCARARSVALLGVVCAAAVLAFTLLLTYWAPADESWDGLYYHQPIVGFALQNHGFSVVELPNTLLAQTINGYPKLGEAFSLWFVLFTDKTLIEIGSSLAAPGLLLAIYTLARRYSSDAAACMGWSVVVLLMPAISSQLRTTMIDIELWLFVLAAVHFATRATLRPSHALLALLACALSLGTKSTSLALIPPILLVVCVRALRHGERARFAPALVAGLGLIASVAALTFGRNWRVFHNPFWPVSYRSALLGVDFPGLATLRQVAPDTPFFEFLRHAYEHPSGGVHDIIVRGYGYAIPWVVWPLGTVALLVCALVVARGLVLRARDAEAENLALVALITLLPLALSPSLSNARYNLQAIVALLLAMVWLCQRWSAARFLEGALAASILLSLMSLVWSDFLWGLNLNWRDVVALARHSKAERASMNFSKFQLSAYTARQREAELGPGDLALFTRELTFIGLLWNDRFSNRVSYSATSDASSLLAEIRARRARWIALGVSNPARILLEASPDFQFVGFASREDKTVIFRLRDSARGR
jgi:hypothetical protein